jgi:hypothetical protein
VLPPSNALCATTFLRIYDTADLSDITEYDYSRESNPIACP